MNPGPSAFMVVQGCNIAHTVQTNLNCHELSVALLTVLILPTTTDTCALDSSANKLATCS